MNPIDDFLKTAGLWDALKRGFSPSGGNQTLGEATMRGLGQALPGAIAGAAMAFGAQGAARGIGAISERISKPRDYKAMLSASPTLKKFDAGQVQMVYNSLRAQSPAMAKDPLIASSFVRRTLEVSPESGPFIDPQTAKMLAETQKNITQARSSRGGVAEAFKPTSIMPINPDPFDTAGKQQREQQFGKQMGQREQQFGKQIGQKEQQFGKQMGQREQQFSEQMGQREQQFSEQMEQRERHHQDKMRQP